MLVKHNASLIITGVVICLFVMFIVLAAFIRPNAYTDDINEPQLKVIAESMAQMIWWMTVALIVLPIMLVLILIAAYMFITANKTEAPKPEKLVASAPAAQKSTFFGKSASGTKLAEASSPNDVLDLRYARGELTRDQYMAIKADMKTQRL
jgi:heme/copper-type cytochrome/quinol oxidase subunit 2